MPKYIELEKALHILDNVMSDEGIKHKGKAIRKRLNELPGEDVVEVEHGEWQLNYNEHRHLTSCSCSVCKKSVFEHAPYIGYVICPYCGAKMDKKEGLNSGV